MRLKSSQSLEKAFESCVERLCTKPTPPTTSSCKRPSISDNGDAFSHCRPSYAEPHVLSTAGAGTPQTRCLTHANTNVRTTVANDMCRGVPAPAVESTCGSAYEGRQCEKASPLSEIEGLLQDDVVGGVGLVQRRSTQLSNAFSNDWEDFKRVYGRTYESDEEEQTRYSIFNEKKATATQRMVGNPKAAHGVTKFSDWSSVEFKGKLLTFRASTEEQKKARPTHVPTAPLRLPEMAKYFDDSVDNSSLPDSWD